MPVQEIPREEWVEFFESFSRQHMGWRIILEVLSAEQTQIAAGQLVLYAIRAALRPDGQDEIAITAGESREQQATHTFTAPARLTLDVTDEGAHQALHIEAAGGLTVRLSFPSAVLPETVDGVLD